MSECRMKISESCAIARDTTISRRAGVSTSEWTRSETMRGATACLFFFQAEDGIRDYKVTGVQTCALPISGVSKAVVEALAVDPAAGPRELLTPRQREILQLVAEGNSTKEIAHGLQLSVKTVETHRSQMMDRLGIRDVAGLIRYAIREGIVGA